MQHRVLVDLPYNPFLVAWTNSLFENAPASPWGFRKRLGPARLAGEVGSGWSGATARCSTSALARSRACWRAGLDINVLVLDTQVYSKNGDRHRRRPSRDRRPRWRPTARCRRERSRLERTSRESDDAPEVFVAQTTAAHVKHFYDAVSDATATPAFAAGRVQHLPTRARRRRCARAHQARLAVRVARVSPAGPRSEAGGALRERLDLKGNPSLRADWHRDKEARRWTSSASRGAKAASAGTSTRRESPRRDPGRPGAGPSELAPAPGDAGIGV